MTLSDIAFVLARRGCTIEAATGSTFLLAHPHGMDSALRTRTRTLLATTHESALREAWLWLHPEGRAASAVATIKHVVATDYGVTHEELAGRDRHEPIATARRIAMALCRELTMATLHKLGEAFDRDHGTVLHAQVSVRDQCETDAAFAARVGTLRVECSSNPHEAQQALARAMGLAAEHNVAIEGLNPDEAAKEKKLTHEETEPRVRESYDARYAWVICRSFFNVDTVTMRGVRIVNGWPRTGENLRWHLRDREIQRAFGAACDKAGLLARITPHCLRHSFGTHFEGDVRDLQALLGHKSLETTQTYRHPHLERATSPLATLHGAVQQ